MTERERQKAVEIAGKYFLMPASYYNAELVEQINNNRAKCVAAIEEYIACDSNSDCSWCRDGYVISEDGISHLHTCDVKAGLHLIAKCTSPKRISELAGSEEGSR